jgi:TRAP-type C4-dicarboxylate transport system permease small subunit
MHILMHRLLRVCDAIAATALAVLLAVVAVNIAARAVFDATGQAVNLMLPGAIELSRYALMVTVFAALPRAAEVGMVRVDLLIERLPAGARGALERLWALGTAAFGGAASWLLIEKARLEAARGDVTQDLEVPMWLLTGFAGIAAAVLCVTGLWLAFRGRR